MSVFSAYDQKKKKRTKEETRRRRGWREVSGGEISKRGYLGSSASFRAACRGFYRWHWKISPEPRNGPRPGCCNNLAEANGGQTVRKNRHGLFARSFFRLIKSDTWHWDESFHWCVYRRDDVQRAYARNCEQLEVTGWGGEGGGEDGVTQLASLNEKSVAHIICRDGDVVVTARRVASVPVGWRAPEKIVFRATVSGSTRRE